jgi:PucR family transcriptional regulator, purine catabolism regulatory protein
MAEITLADLLAWEPRLRAARAAGGRAPAAGQAVGADLDRELTWAVAARATAPMLPPLRGGELVLLPHRILAESGATIEPLLRELGGHGVAAVLLEAEAVPSGRPPLPILVLPVGPMGPDLEGELNRLLTQRRGELYRVGTDLGRLLAGLTTAGADVAQVLGATAASIGIPAAVFDARGLLLASSGPEAGGAPDERVTIELAGGETLALGPVEAERRALARLVGERVAVAVEAGLARAARERPRGPARAAALAAFLTGGGVGPAATQAAALGLPADGAFRVALAAPALGAAGVQRALAPLGFVHDAGEIDGAPAAVVETRAEGVLAAGGAKPRPPQGAAPRPGWLALSGPVAGAPALPEGARQARYVAALLAAGLLRGPVARFDAVRDVGAFQLLYRSWGSPELAAFAAEALGELPARDRRGTLRGTLLAYLETGGSHVEAASRLAIHRNTLAYRLKQIAALTGQDPADPSTRLALHLALLAEALPPAPP